MVLCDIIVCTETNRNTGDLSLGAQYHDICAVAQASAKT